MSNTLFKELRLGKTLVYTETPIIEVNTPVISGEGSVSITFPTPKVFPQKFEDDVYITVGNSLEHYIPGLTIILYHSGESSNMEVIDIYYHIENTNVSTVFNVVIYPLQTPLLDIVFYVDNLVYNIPYTGRTYSIPVYSNVDWEISLITANWLSAVKTASGLLFSAAKNTSSSSKTGQIVLTTNTQNPTSITITVTIAAFEITTLSVSKQTISFPYTGGTDTISVIANCEWELDLSKFNATSITVTKTNNETITVQAETNQLTNIVNTSFIIKTYDENVKKTIDVVLGVDENYTFDPVKLWKKELNPGVISTNLSERKFLTKAEVNEVNNKVRSFHLRRLHNFKEYNGSNILIISERPLDKQTDELFLSYLNTINGKYMLTGDVIGLTEYNFTGHNPDDWELANYALSCYFDFDNLNSKAILIQGARNGVKLRLFINNDTTGNFIGLKLDRNYFISSSTNTSTGAVINYNTSYLDPSTEAYLLINVTLKGKWTKLSAPANGPGPDYCYEYDVETQTVGDTPISKAVYYLYNGIYKTVSKSITRYGSTANENVTVIVKATPRAIELKNDFIFDGSDNEGNRVGGLILDGQAFYTEHSLNMYKLNVWKNYAQYRNNYSFVLNCNSEIDLLQIENCRFRGVPNQTINSMSNSAYHDGLCVKMFYITTPLYIDPDTHHYEWLGKKDNGNYRSAVPLAPHINHVLIKENDYTGINFLQCSTLYCTQSFRVLDNILNNTNRVIDLGVSNGLEGGDWPGYLSCPMYFIGNQYSGRTKLIRNENNYGTYVCALLAETGRIYFANNTVKNYLSTIRKFTNTTYSLTYHNKEVEYTIPCIYEGETNNPSSRPIHSVFSMGDITFTGTGESNLTYLIPSNGKIFDIKGFTVKVNNVAWTRIVDTTNFTSSTSKKYKLHLVGDGSTNLELVFGSNNSAPQEGSTITLSYSYKVTAGTPETYDIYGSCTALYYLNNTISNIGRIGASSGNLGLAMAKRTKLPYYNSISKSKVDGRYVFVDEFANALRCIKFNNYNLDLEDNQLLKSFGNIGFIEDLQYGTILNINDLNSSLLETNLGCYGPLYFENLKSEFVATYNANYNSQYSENSEGLQSLLSFLNSIADNYAEFTTLYGDGNSIFYISNIPERLRNTIHYSVFVNDIRLGSSECTFTISGSTGIIKFVTPPPKGAVVKLIYGKDELTLRNFINSAFYNENIDYDYEVNMFGKDKTVSYFANGIKLFPLGIPYTVDIIRGIKKFIFSNNKINYGNNGQWLGLSGATVGGIQQLEMCGNNINIGYIPLNKFSNGVYTNGNANSPNYLYNSTNLSNFFFVYFLDREYYANGSGKDNSYILVCDNKFNTLLLEDMKLSFLAVKFYIPSDYLPSTLSAAANNYYTTHILSDRGVAGITIFRNNKVNNELVDNYILENIKGESIQDYPKNSKLLLAKLLGSPWSLKNYTYYRNNNPATASTHITESEIGYIPYEEE